MPSFSKIRHAKPCRFSEWCRIVRTISKNVYRLLNPVTKYLEYSVEQFVEILAVRQTKKRTRSLSCPMHGWCWPGCGGNIIDNKTSACCLWNIIFVPRGIVRQTRANAVCTELATAIWTNESYQYEFGELLSCLCNYCFHNQTIMTFVDYSRPLRKAPIDA